MKAYSLRKSDDPNELIVFCHQCEKELKADKRMGKKLTPPQGLAWQGEPPCTDDLLWGRLIDNHDEVCP